MESKVITPQVLAAPDSPKSDPISKKQDSRGMQIIQYLTRTVSGNGLKDANTQETRSCDFSDSEESDDDIHTHAHAHQSSSDAIQPSLVRKLLHKFAKAESFHVEEEKGHASQSTNGWGMISRGLGADFKGSFSWLLEMRSMVIEKLASMPSVPAETLEHARHSIESIISDATHSAYGKTRDAMVRIRVKLIEIIPYLSPQETKKVVENVGREVLDMSKAKPGDSSQPEKTNEQAKDGRVGVSTSTASAVISPQPTSGFAANMDHSKAWGLLRSRL